MTWRKFRCKARCGLSCQWAVGKNKEGKWKAMSLGKVKQGRSPVPLDFVPFELSNAVLNGPVFETQTEAEIYVRGL